MPFNFHPMFLIVILIIVLIVFGPGKLPELGAGLGRGIKEFRKHSDALKDEVSSAVKEHEQATASAAPVTTTAAVAPVTEVKPSIEPNPAPQAEPKK